MNDIELGAELENMTLSDGWKHISGWMDNQERIILEKLKTYSFESLSEVQRLQAELEAYRKLRGEIKDKIRRAAEARKKLETK